MSEVERLKVVEMPEADEGCEKVVLFRETCEVSPVPQLGMMFLPEAGKRKVDNDGNIHARRTRKKTKPKWLSGVYSSCARLHHELISPRKCDPVYVTRRQKAHQRYNWANELHALICRSFIRTTRGVTTLILSLAPPCLMSRSKGEIDNQRPGGAAVLTCADFIRLCYFF